jgi:hypothetical protein
MHITIILVIVLALIVLLLPVSEPMKQVDVKLDASSDPNQDILDYRPNQPSPVDLDNTQPYHLLSDIMGEPRVKESLSCVDSRSCYATDFQRTIEKTGNYKKQTNNYKRK